MGSGRRRLVQDVCAVDQIPGLALVEDALLTVPQLAADPGDGAVIAATLDLSPIEAGTPGLSHAQHALAKRAMDLVIACALLVVLAPLLALIALLVVVDSTGPVLYRAARVGAHGRMLEVLKFRKMRADARGCPLTVAGDERFTRIGRWLARTKLDELPQLINVVRGEMSLIGPRPEDAAFVERHRDAFDVILRVRPGMTGLSQLAYRAESEILDRLDPIADYEDRVLPQKLALDRLYVARANALLDLRILGWTFLTTVMAVPVAVNRATAHISLRCSSGGRRMPGDGWWASLPRRRSRASGAAATAGREPDTSLDLVHVEERE